MCCCVVHSLVFGMVDVHVSTFFFSVLKKWIFYLLFFSGNVHVRYFLSNAEIREFVYVSNIITD